MCNHYTPRVRKASVNVTHLHKTNLKSRVLLLEYDAPFDSETHPLYNDTKTIILLQSKLNIMDI